MKLYYAPGTISLTRRRRSTLPFCVLCILPPVTTGRVPSRDGYAAPVGSIGLERKIED
jgi:hypothetical protein